MARNPRNPSTAATNAVARLKALKIAKPAKVGATSKIGVRQTSSPMSAAQKARLANFRAQARALFGR